jgi:uncharacterized protein YndB with AHSA1/START domain
MKNNLPFEFTVDKTKNTVFVNRAFAAELPLVWDAFTKQEILDQWWAPKPWSSKTKYMKFEVGGRRFYAMVSPEGQEHWSAQDYTAISAMTNFKFLSVFTDKDENINTAISGSNWNLDFVETNGVTTVRIKIKHQTLADLEQHIQMGFKEGFTMTLNELDKMLGSFSKYVTN